MNFIAQPPNLRRFLLSTLVTKSFAVICPLALVGAASVFGFCSSARDFITRFFQSFPRGRLLAVHVGRRDLLPRGLSPPIHAHAGHTKDSHNFNKSWLRE